MIAALQPRWTRPARVAERNVTAYRHTWIIIVSGFAEPFLYLLGIGFGVGSLVGSIHTNGHNYSYAMFVAPALMASSAMNGSIFETTYNFFHKLRITRTYDTVLATPLGIGDVVLGEILWALSRSAIYSTAFLAVMAGFGLLSSPWALLALPSAWLMASTFAGFGLYATTFVRDWNDFDLIQLFLLPMFLFSATFYPLNMYPPAAQIAVQLTPLYHGVHLLRSFSTGDISPALCLDALYLIGSTTLVFYLARRRLTARLLR